MKNILETITSEFQKFETDSKEQSEKGNKAAGSRARKSALELSKLFKEFRKISIEESKK